MRKVVSISVCLLMFVQSAVAQNKPSLIVSPLRGKNTKAAMDAIGKEFKDSGQVYVIDFEKVLEYSSGSASKSEKKSPKDALAEFEKGKKAYENLNIQESIQAFEKSKKLYQEILGDENSFAGLRSAQFNLAMAYLADQKSSQAKSELQQMILIDPKRDKTKPSEKYYSPQVRELYQKVLKEVEAGEKGDIQIITTPSGARVFMDGVAQGVTPTDIKNIPAGRHYFRFVTGDGRDEFIEKTISSGSNEVELTIAPVSTGDTSGNFQTLGNQKELSQQRAAYLDEMGLALGADLFVFLTPLQGQVKGQLYDQRSQELSPEITDVSPQSLVAKLLRSIGPDGYVIPSDGKATGEATDTIITPSSNQESPTGSGVVLKPRSNTSKSASTSQGLEYNEPSPKESIGSDSKPWYQNKWIWIGIGAGLIGAGAVLYATGSVNFDSSASTVRATIP